MLYHALCRSASALAQAGDPAAARSPLDELQALEDPAWPPQRLLWGAEAAQVVARLGGDAHGTLERSRRLVALDRARGSDASIALGNLVDHELAAGDAAAAARSGAALVATLQGTRNEYSMAFARINLCAAYLALDDLRAGAPGGAGCLAASGAVRAAARRGRLPGAAGGTREAAPRGGAIAGLRASNVVPNARRRSKPTRLRRSLAPSRWPRRRLAMRPSGARTPTVLPCTTCTSQNSHSAAMTAEPQQ